MCPNHQLLNQSKNGTLSFCCQNKFFRLVFNNLCFELYEWELQKFKKYLHEIDVPYWEKRLAVSINSRRIPITIGCKHVMVLVNRHELFELQQLLENEQKMKWLGLKDIDYNFIEN
ncbi:hypothetical protein HCU67_13395 [Muricauda sp. DJ-13]|uniref:Uncharacterized protein n=2 Tax=Croceivirga thetidis TaxID=2721623 RepID=A0ABX1GV91_9FLAO|nr:hypothetical protein [Croceivirga thetidis]